MNHFHSTAKVLMSTCFLFFALTSLRAQDPHFSQFYSAPLQMNPALSGVFSGEYRFIANYRTQYYTVLGNQAYKTIAASFEGRRRVGRDDYYSISIAALKDQAGESDFSRSRAVLGASYLKHLGGGRYRSSDQYLVGGAQLGIAQWNYDWENLWFSQQFQINGQQAFINRTLSNGENFNTLSTDMFVDFNAGLLYYNVIDKNNSFYLGGSLQHLNEPNVSFVQNASETLLRRWVAQAGGEISLTREISLLPAIAVMGQGASFFGITGMNLRFTNHDWREIAIRAGLWGRISNQGEDRMGLDAMVVSTILEVERWQFGLSYDITVSDWANANNSRGAFELSLIYIHPAKERFKVSCPRF